MKNYSKIFLILCVLSALCGVSQSVWSEDGVRSSLMPHQGDVSTSQVATGAYGEVAVLRAQLIEMRRSEDRLLSTVHWSLGVVLTIALALAVFSWWTSSNLHKQDLQRVTEQLRREMDDVIANQTAEARRALGEAQRVEHTRQQAEMVAFTMWKIGALRLASGDISGAIDAAFEQASAALPGNSNYVTHSIIALSAAFRAAISSGSQIELQRILDSRQLIIRSGLALSDYGLELSRLIDQYERR